MNRLKAAPWLCLFEGFEVAFGHIEPVVPVRWPTRRLVIVVKHLHLALGGVGEMDIDFPPLVGAVVEGHAKFAQRGR